MKILMTTDTVGGVWTYAMQLCAALAEHHISVVLATMGPPANPAQLKQVRQLSNVELFESTYKLEWMDNPWDEVRRAGRWLIELERCTKPDVVHLNGYAHGSLPWKAPVLMVAHSCVLSWWRAVNQQEAPSEWDTYRGAVVKGLAAADLIVAPSQAMLQSIHEIYAPPVPRRLIANGSDPAMFKPQTNRQAIVLAAGRVWDPAKNITLLDQAAGNLPWPVWVAGSDRIDGGPPRRLQHARALGQLPTEALIPWMNSAAIFAAPAKYEPFGLSILEAALGGCALVLGDIPSLRELWNDAALYVDPTNADDLRRVLNQLIADANHRSWLSERSRTRALQMTHHRMADDYQHVYRQLRSQGRRRLSVTRSGTNASCAS